MNEIEIVATGPDFIRMGVRGFESVLEELIKSAQTEIQVVAYLITPSALPILRLLLNASEKGVVVTIIVNNIQELDKEVKKFLLQAQKKLGKLFYIVSFRELTGKDIHAKLVVVDRKKALIGSANLSWGGIVGNYEIGVLIKGEYAWQIAKMIDTLLGKEEKMFK